MEGQGAQAAGTTQANAGEWEITVYAQGVADIWFYLTVVCQKGETWDVNYEKGIRSTGITPYQYC